MNLTQITPIGDPSLLEDGASFEATPGTGWSRLRYRRWLNASDAEDYAIDPDAPTWFLIARGEDGHADMPYYHETRKARRQLILSHPDGAGGTAAAAAAAANTSEETPPASNSTLDASIQLSDTLTMRYGLRNANISMLDPASVWSASGGVEAVVDVEIRSVTENWIGFAVSHEGKMVLPLPSVAVVGSADGVAELFLHQKMLSSFVAVDPPSVLPGATWQPTGDGGSVLRFSRMLRGLHPDDITIDPDTPHHFIFAHGEAGSTLPTFHGLVNKGSTLLVLSKGCGIASSHENPQTQLIHGASMFFG